MAKLIVPGRAVPPETPQETLLDGLVTVRTVHQAEAEGTTTRGAVAEHLFEDAQDDDIVEVEWDGGVREWISVGQLRQSLETNTSTGRGIAPEPATGADLRIPAFRQSVTGTRGAGGWTLKILKIFRIDLAGDLATAGVRELTRRIEDRIEPALHRLREDFTFAPADDLPDEAPGPYLVFLHGTASSTRGSFGGLTGKDEETGKIPKDADKEWKALRGIYEDRILALEHRTMSVSPVQNALDLARDLPKGAKLHLVSHSRGGLVGELLCRGRYDPEELESFAKREDGSLLLDLSGVLAEKSFTIERFVRVACPARGTVLASWRLDLYLSVLLNLFGLIPGLKGTLWYDIVKAVLLAAAKKRSDVSELPGLEAMMPESPFIRLLNSTAVETTADLGVIAGDIEGEGIWGHLKVFATDLFYLQDHDLVVNTRSMYGGVGRNKVWFLFDKGPKISHFNYFRNDRTREALHNWLTRTGETAKDFEERQKPAATGASRGESQGSGKGPAVFLVPDLFGSSLALEKGKPVWIDLHALARGGMTRLGIDSTVDRDELRLLPGVYEPLGEKLGLTYQVFPFPYDWRRSFEETGNELARSVEDELDRREEPVHIVAHGAGGLAVRAMIAKHSGLWQRLRSRGGRAVLLGTPNHGSYFALGLLLGQEKLVRLLGLLDSKHGPSDLLAILRKYPSLYEMLPQDLFDEQKRQALGEVGSAVEGNAALKARNVRAGWDAGSRDGLLYVAGAAPWTPSGIRREDGRLRLERSSKGDGLVSYELGLLAGIPTWYVDAAHSELVSHDPLLKILPELLDRGSTVQLRRLPPTVELAVKAQEDEPLLFPSLEDLWQAALGEQTLRPATRFRLSVSVAHGDLQHSRRPVAVGHYSGDTIVNAEKVLDRQLGGALLRRYQMGIYPGPAGTSEVIHMPAAQPPGVLVIGLGELGEVTAQKVTSGVTRALLRYALQLLESDNERPGSQKKEYLPAGFSAVLLGAGGGRSISVEESVTAIVEGALEANRALKVLKVKESDGQTLWERVHIDEVQVIELYETVAIRAAHAARSLESQLRFSLQADEELAIAPYLKTLPGGRVRPPVNQYATGWWRRLQITAGEGAKKGSLVFESLTERARTEERTQDLPRHIVDQFVADAASRPLYNREVASTLFELLLPNTLKDQAQNEIDMVLLLDRTTAQYPWELLTERGRSDPLAVCAGLVRQLRLSEGEILDVVHAPSHRSALVVGEPQSSGWKPLPKARDEARAVAEVLQKNGYATTPLIGSDGLRILRELYARDYQIVHLAGHGSFDPAHPDKTGMVIGDGLFLTAALIRRLRPVPPFVFLNCCHLGKIDSRELPSRVDDLRRLAASLSTELIAMGARAVVAAGWAINDRLAELFARTLYEELLAGKTFGRATLRARQAIYKELPEDNTWAAYQCYGDPDFVLEPQKEDRDRDPDPRVYVAPREFLDELESLHSAARSASSEDREKLRQRLDQVEAALPVEWRTGELLEALAAARNQLGQWQEAIAAYKAALEAEEAEVSLKAIQSLANLMARSADRLRQEIPPKEQQKLIGEARRYLEKLLQLGRTSERLSLQGSLYKRIALRARNKQDRRNALQKAAESYKGAYEVSAERGEIDPYPALNWIACRHLLGSLTKDEPEQLEKLIQKCEARAGQLVEHDPSFFHRLYPADLALHRHLLQGNLAKSKEDVLQLYRRALAVGSGFTESSSMREHFGFLLRMMDPKSPAAGALQEIADELAK